MLEGEFKCPKCRNNRFRGIGKFWDFPEKEKERVSGDLYYFKIENGEMLTKSDSWLEARRKIWIRVKDYSWFGYNEPERYYCLCGFNSTSSQDFLPQKKTMKNYDENEIKNLKNKLKEYEKVIEEQKRAINDLQNKLYDSNNIANNNELITSLRNTIIRQQKELIQLNNKIENKQSKIQSGEEKIIIVNFLSSDQKVNFSIPCNINEVFAFIEEKLYEQFPEYRETNNFFLFNGKQILRFKTLYQNGIKSGIPLILIQYK